jgi:elongation factor G
VGQLTFIRVYSGQLNQETLAEHRPRAQQALGVAPNTPTSERHQQSWRAISRAVGLKNVYRRHHLRRKTSHRWSHCLHGSGNFGAVEPRPSRPGKDGHGTFWPGRSTFKVHTDPTATEAISGMGEVHLEIIVDRMMRDTSQANVGPKWLIARPFAGNRKPKASTSANR